MHKITTLSLAAILFSSAITGCSGGRLKNLVSRSDYMTLEEVEKEDALTAEREAEADRKAFANAEKELSGTEGQLVSSEKADGATGTATDTETVEPETKRSRFSLAGLFRRGEDAESEVTPDPFVPESEKLPKSEFEADSDTATPIVAAKEKAPEQESTTKKTAEASVGNLFEEAVASTEAQAAEEIEKAISQAEAKAEELPESFGEYLKAQRETVDATAESASENAEQAFAELENKATEEPAEAFDAILNNIAETETPPAKPELSSDLFPSLDEIVAAPESEVTVADAGAPEMPSTADLFEEITSPQDNPSEAPLDELAFGSEASEDTFSEASEKHGFGKLAKSDPWAAFEESAAQPQAPKIDNKFAWANTPAQNDNASDFDWGTEESSGTSTRPQLTQVSSVEVSSPDTEFMESPFQPKPENTGLVIPDDARPTPINFDEDFLGMPAAEESPAFDAPLEDSAAPAAEPTANAAAPAAAKPASGGWSTRTWFLVVGCAMVVAMLLLPERKNRVNA